MLHASIPDVDTDLELNGLLREKRFALVVVDVQNDFTHPDGLLSGEGLDLAHAAALVPRINRFASQAREANVPVFYTQMLSGGAESSEADQVLRNASGRGHRVACEAGTWGAEFDSNLDIQAGDTIVEKSRYSAFVGTDFVSRLTQHGCDGVIICGLTADVCVDATARHAFMLDLHVVVATDLTASVLPKNKEPALAALKRHAAHLRTSDQIESIWAMSPAPHTEERKQR